MNKVEEEKKLSDDLTSTLTRRTYLCYGVGHMLNDLTSAMWFSYLLLFLHYGLQFSNSEAGLLLLIGQVADGMATPIVGFLSDKGAGHWMCRYGHRKSWHLVGTLCVVASFPFIYSPCFIFEFLGKDGKLVYYSIFIIIFQLGWASVQVSHLSLAPDLSPHQQERTGLLTVRYSFTVLANMMVHLFTWILFASYKNKGTTKTIGTEDKQKFQIVALFVVAIGSVFTLIFHTGIREKIPVKSSSPTKENQPQKIMKRTSVLTEFGLYHIMMVYMMSQLYANQSQVLIPMYLEEYLRVEAERLPMLPLIMFISSSLTSICTKALNNNCGRKTTYIIGSSVAVFTCTIVYFGEGRIYTKYIIYAVAALFGVAASIIMVTSQGIVADLIGEHTTHGAFVYGLMSFADKMSNGIAVMIIQHFKSYSDAIEYYRDMLIIMCGCSVIVGLLCVIALPKDFKLFAKKMDDESITATRIVYCLETDPNNSSNSELKTLHRNENLLKRRKDAEISDCTDRAEIWMAASSGNTITCPTGNGFSLRCNVFISPLNRRHNAVISDCSIELKFSRQLPHPKTSSPER
ncbi:hypothetical protein V9T40_002706 [Parthenolecanium corni]|uniref:Major facilitator superfamily domain-containing protein 12-like n=1 Tax=Parthenolecanium corni TaxID=536013 RepID=A0AAN9Y5V5_9HEMI